MTKSFYKCKNCGDEIAININSRLVCCKCGKLGIDGDECFVRIVGNKDDFDELFIFNCFSTVTGEAETMTKAISSLKIFK